MEPDELVRGYLARLGVAARGLSPDRRQELLAEVREHIESALAAAEHRDEATTRNVLERLGAPEEIVAAETGGEPPAGGLAPGVVIVERRSGWGATEVAAVLLLILGGILLPVIGPLIGLALVWSSTQWTSRQKWTASAIVVVLLVLPVVLLWGMASTSMSIYQQIEGSQ